MTLPAYSTPTINELRAFWHRYRDRDVRRLILEVQHLRDTLEEIEYFRSVIERAWKEEDLGQLVALEKLRVLMQSERSRLGVLSGLPPAAPAE
jgi:hypothetical protein